MNWSDVAPFLMVVAIVAIVFAYKTVQLIVTRGESQKTKRPRGRRERRHEASLDLQERADLAQRAEDLRKRLETLEEIMANDKKSD